MSKGKWLILIAVLSSLSLAAALAYDARQQKPDAQREALEKLEALAQKAKAKGELTKEEKLKRAEEVAEELAEALKTLAAKTPAPAQTPPSAQPAVSQIDYRDYVLTPGRVLIGKGARVGYAIVARSEVGGRAIETLTAIVGETETSWLIETDQVVSAMPQLQDHLLALTVNKSDGKVTRAVCGKPGGALKEVKIGRIFDAPKPPEGTETELTLSTEVGGPHRARVVEINGARSYSGLDGELEGVPLKYDAEQGGYELEAMPEARTMKVGASEIAIKTIKLSSGVEFWVTEDPVVSALQPYGDNGWGQAGLKSQSYSLKLTHIVRDHKAALDWR